MRTGFPLVRLHAGPCKAVPPPQFEALQARGNPGHLGVSFIGSGGRGLRPLPSLRGMHIGLGAGLYASICVCVGKHACGMQTGYQGV